MIRPGDIIGRLILISLQVNCFNRKHEQEDTTFAEIPGHIQYQKKLRLNEQIPNKNKYLSECKQHLFQQHRESRESDYQIRAYH